jgi:hypothetical protein
VEHVSNTHIKQTMHPVSIYCSQPSMPHAQTCVCVLLARGGCCSRGCVAGTLAGWHEGCSIDHCRQPTSACLGSPCTHMRRQDMRASQDCAQQK